ncbi:conserved hypothetical protein [Streptomyces pristinaespiralis ATCC 25486]|uniref:Uncharacterized protein n=1 Tax=Streptomyces pristinaespiralis (strain ATCC 25486 / DSM 40338 / CBS 914.69 / JCM 4507 / KCC S-0507 / NBRC 13074 / NRRL 2958 / 5647) TaxID=457429 RepID=B5H975_STRE2|nr:conserved hypothetical protein [Streptomyces pristinaespiralis ATCC 25486]
MAGDVGGGTEFTAEGVADVLREACEAASLDATGAELLRLGSDAVYRLASLPIIVRIARDPVSCRRWNGPWQWRAG